MRHPFQDQPKFEPMSVEQAAAYDSLIDAALSEDIGAGDATTDAIVDASAAREADIVARSPGTIAGLALAVRTLQRFEPRIAATLHVRDGSSVAAGAILAHLAGPARGLLTGERVALNFLGRLSGIATLTRQYVDAVGDRPTRIVDTRKTTPGMRALERYAVRAGGGANHRFGLADAILVKDNHIEAVGSVGEAVARARARARGGTIVEVECDHLGQVRDAVASGADAILLDNMDVDTMRTAVDIARGNAIVEASGGMTLARIAEVSETGVDVISIGALTHSAPALDVALDFSMRDAKVKV